MKIKLVFQWFYQQAKNYNLFILNENDYHEEEETRDPEMTLKYQKYTTRLYIILLFLSMYVLFYATIMKSQIQTVIVNNIDVMTFERLYSEHRETLSCPCSTITISYKQFVSNHIQFHPICTSLFVNQQWIEALYVSNRSSYSLGDFRVQAHPQFQLLSSFCSIFQEIILTNQINIDNNQLISISLRPKSDVQLEVDAIIQSFQSSLSNRILSCIDYLQIITQKNDFITALGTNTFLLYTDLTLEDPTYYLVSQLISYMRSVYNGTQTATFYCRIDNPIIAAVFYPDYINLMNLQSLWIDPILLPDAILVKGFFTGCTPFDSLLAATLDCLYEIDCLQLFADNVPSLNQTNLNLSNHVLLSNQTNRTIYEYLSNLFIDKWTITINYTTYLQSCNPLTCTYTIADRMNYSYSITLLISLYGGLILILRLISSILIKILSKIKCQSISLSKIYLQKSIQWIKRLNLFKDVNQRTENNIKQQKLITRIYLILLLSMNIYFTTQ